MFETGLSDHRKLTTNVLRKTVGTGNCKKIFYWDCRRLDQKKFEAELKLKLNSQENINYCTFQAVFLEILNKIARANVFMTKFLRKQQCLNPGSKMISTRKCLMKTGIIIGSKEIFMLKFKKNRPKKIF